MKMIKTIYVVNRLQDDYEDRTDVALLAFNDLSAANAYKSKAEKTVAKLFAHYEGMVGYKTYEAINAMSENEYDKWFEYDSKRNTFFGVSFYVSELKLVTP